MNPRLERIMMIESIKESLNKSLDFGGKASRREYWIFYFFYLLSTFVGSFIGELFGIGIISDLLLVALFVPFISCAVRRMHDVGKRGWFILIPIYGFILTLTPTKSTKLEN